MGCVLVATDAAWVHDEVEAALATAEREVRWVRRGMDVPAAVRQLEPDLVVLDLQIGNMGGMATAIGLRLEAGAGRLPSVPILMLLDRDADVFLAKRSEADGWLVKPVDAIRLRKAARALFAGGGYREKADEPEPAGAPLPT